MLAERLDGIHIDELAEHVVVDGFDFLNFVRRAEAVKEMYKRHAALDRRQMGDTGQIHALLHGAGTEKRKACLTGSHHVRVISEDGQGVSGQRPCRYVKNAGQQFAGNFVHVWNH